jgi:hypothetical protein
MQDRLCPLGIAGLGDRIFSDAEEAQALLAAASCPV